MAIRVVVVEDHLLVQKALCRFLGTRPVIEVVGVASDGMEAVHLVEATPADVILMDVSLPGVGGIEATRLMVAANPDVNVIMVSHLDDDGTVAAAITAGAMGYVPKTCTMDELLAAIESVYCRRPYISAAVCSPILKGFMKGRGTRSRKNDPLALSARETEVLHLVAEGRTLKSIGRDLSISPRTAESHIARIKRKLGIATLAGLVKYAIKNNITSLEQ